MKVAQKIERIINEIAEGTSFGYKDLDIFPNEYATAAKAIERIVKKGLIKKLAKGKFYKPQQTIFGELKPSEEELLKPYLFEDGHRIAYISGVYLYNQMGLTTQIPVLIKVASQTKRIYINIGSIHARPIKSYAKVTDENYRMLGFLDAMKDFKNIPDLNIKSAVKIFLNQLSELKTKEISELINLAILYPPRVRAFLGALLDSLGNYNEINKLKESLNPLSKYELGISSNILKNAQEWNIQ
jgi:hypothetical protein